MKTFLIYGEKNAGKTTTCRRLLNTLRGLAQTVNFYEFFEWGDFKSILTINDKKVAIYSAGDEKYHLQAALDFGKAWECDVLVAVVSYRIHYNEPLEEMEAGKDFIWHTLEKGVDEKEMEINELRITLELLNKIATTVGL